MKKIMILTLSISAMVSFTQCSKPSADKLCSDADTRGKIITELVNNNDYRIELMDSIMGNMDAMQMMAGNQQMMHSMMSGGRMEMMMDHMMGMTNTDSMMFKMMLHKTMNMCDQDESKYKMMMGAMKEHPKGMESMKNMGMHDMDGKMKDGKMIYH